MFDDGELPFLPRKTYKERILTVRANSNGIHRCRMMAIARAFPGFNDLGRSATPMIIFFIGFLRLEKENLSIKSSFFCVKCAIVFRYF